MNINKLLNLSNKKLSKEVQEDLNGKSFNNDISSKYLFTNSSKIKCKICNREKIILCGAKFIENFLKSNFPKIKFNSPFKDGDKIRKNSKIFLISGNAKIILGIERTILNFLQHLSSISTTTHEFVTKMGKVNTTLLNTRKTTIGLRKFEKYATLIGGAKNHRMGLYDDILIKDNHIKIIGNDKTIHPAQRLDREGIMSVNYFSLMNDSIVDVHLPRPYEEYKGYIDKIYDTLMV